MNEQDNDQFVAKARERFDESVERLDASTLSQLNQSRHRALAEAGQTSLHGQWMRWVPVTGIATAAVVAVMVMNGQVVMTDEPITTTDFELLLEDDNLEMFEDLEFYSWLDTADLDANGDVG